MTNLYQTPYAGTPVAPKPKAPERPAPYPVQPAAAFNAPSGDKGGPPTEDQAAPKINPLTGRPEGAPPLSIWQQKGYVDPEGKVTLPWGERVSFTDAMNMYYKDRRPTGDEVPPWVLGTWNEATGTGARQYQNAPSWFGDAMQNLYNQTYTNAVRAGQPPVGVGGYIVQPDYWKSQGWVDPDGKVSLPTGQRVSLTEAMNMYYKDRKPAANEVPLWARAQASPVQYINSVPAHLRAIYEQLLGQAYPAGSANRPPVSYMQKQASFQ